MPTAKTACPHCQKRFSFDDSKAGKTAKCPGCSEKFTLKAAAPKSQQKPKVEPLPQFDEPFDKRFVALATQDELATMSCRFCAEPIQRNAIKCKHCGEFLDGRKPAATEPAPPNKGSAMALSFLFPGLGQIYRGHTAKGMIWMVVTIAGYMFFVIPGLVLHLACICEAGTD